jgi:hypothetical protein
MKTDSLSGLSSRIVRSAEWLKGHNHYRFPPPSGFVGDSAGMGMSMPAGASDLAGGAGAFLYSGPIHGLGLFHLDDAGTIWITFIIPRSSWMRRWQ